MNKTQVEQREEAYGRSGGVCEVCGKPLTSGTMQAGHRIGNTKAWRAKFGSFVIDHPLNIGYCCSLQCNSKLDISFDRGKVLALLVKIATYELEKHQGKEW